MSSLFTVPELAIGVGLSEAASVAFEPKLEVPKQSAWASNPRRVPDLALIAELVAGGKVTMKDGKDMANRLGFDNGTMESIVWLAQNRLDFAVMLRLWRRFGAFDAGDNATLSDLFDKTIAHERLDWDYRDWLRRLKTAELPGIGDIAYGVVRGLLPAPAYVPVAPPTSGDYVPRFPVVNIDPEQLAAAQGFDKKMLQLMVGRSGLSMAPIMAAQALFRSNAAQTISGLPDIPGVAPFNVKPYVGPNDYLLAIAEGDLRTEWADSVRETARQILTSGEYAELELRGYIDKPTRRALTAQHGMSQFDSDLLYDVIGRAPSERQVYIGLARGAKYPSTYADVPSPFREALQRSNIRPEWADIAYANRYSLPAPFVVRALLTDGAIDQARGSTILQHEGWPQDLADLVSTHYAAKAGATGDPHVGKAQTQLWTTTHRSYVAAEINDATATAALQTAGVAAGSIPAVLRLWAEERSLIRKQLSPAQIKKAWHEQVVNPATGAPWTQAQAIAELEARGYDAADAQTLLEL